ncbi:MAG: hypothetical protein JRJ44_05720 [Deltaproteobacteria bacterium]|nr:hypothetical protein [Deltaproteobacteria bacterium]
MSAVRRNFIKQDGFKNIREVVIKEMSKIFCVAAFIDEETILGKFCVKKCELFESVA